MRAAKVTRRHVASRLAILILATGFLPACGLTRICPTTVAQATSGDFAAVRSDTFVAVGRVIRYVPSPTGAARGYDLGVAHIFQGAPPDGTLFLSVAEPYPAISDRDPVLIIGDTGDRSVIAPGECPALQPIDESELEPWNV